LVDDEFNGFTFEFFRENTTRDAFHGFACQVEKITSTCPFTKTGLAQANTNPSNPFAEMPDIGIGWRQALRA
jgi:hypothetical protein